MLEHTILIGTTGMLAGMTRALTARSQRCTLIARNPERMLRVAPDALHIQTSWDDPNFPDALAHALALQGPADLIVAWVHSGHPRAWDAIFEATHEDTSLVEVVGSAALDPTRPDLTHRARAQRLGVEHVVAALGYALDSKGKARWLTHIEISAGVLEAIERGEDVVVGRSSPWPPPF